MNIFWKNLVDLQKSWAASTEFPYGPLPYTASPIIVYLL